MHGRLDSGRITAGPFSTKLKGANCQEMQADVPKRRNGWGIQAEKTRIAEPGKRGQPEKVGLDKLRFPERSEKLRPAKCRRLVVEAAGLVPPSILKAANAANPSPCTAGETLAPEQIGENPISRNGENRKCRERNF